VDVEDPVQLGLGRQVVEPVDELLVVGAMEGVVDLHYLGPVERRLAEPALTIATNPGRVGQFLEPRDRLLGPGARRPVVAAEQPPVDLEPVRVGQNPLERRYVPVDVVQDPEHGYIGSQL
jgi:hypothetical protein